MPSPTAKQLAQREAFGRRVRSRRSELGISQESLAHDAGLDRSYVGQVERGERNITLDNIYRIADALKVNGRDLL
ncbi:MAG TPA: helix-turn-helix transcriptional regulator [Galbitalea sp.]|nr:helix-turn-helix transcriptional regulator [Galbitalea sp.]